MADHMADHEVLLDILISKNEQVDSFLNVIGHIDRCAGRRRRITLRRVCATPLMEFHSILYTRYSVPISVSIGFWEYCSDSSSMQNNCKLANPYSQPVQPTRTVTNGLMTKGEWVPCILLCMGNSVPIGWG
jgi:hypothetical protein